MSATQEEIQSLSNELGEIACGEFIKAFKNDLAKRNALLVLRAFLQHKKILPEEHNLKQQHAYVLYTGFCPITFLSFVSEQPSEETICVLSATTISTGTHQDHLRLLNEHFATDSRGKLFARHPDHPTNQITYQTGTPSPCHRPDEHAMVED